MKTELIHTLMNNFETHAQQTEEGIEFGLLETYRHYLVIPSGKIFRILSLRRKYSSKILGILFPTIFLTSGKWLSLVLVERAISR